MYWFCTHSPFLPYCKCMCVFLHNSVEAVSLLPGGTQGLNSGNRTWQQVSLPLGLPSDPGPKFKSNLTIYVVSTEMSNSSPQSSWVPRGRSSYGQILVSFLWQSTCVFSSLAQELTMVLEQLIFPYSHWSLDNQQVEGLELDSSFITSAKDNSC